MRYHTWQHSPILPLLSDANCVRWFQFAFDYDSGYEAAIFPDNLSYQDLLMLVVTLPCATIIILLHTTAVHERQGCGSDSVQLRFSGRHIHPSSFRYFLYVRYSYSGIISVHFICLGFYDLLLYWYHFFHFDAEKIFLSAEIIIL